MNVISTCHRSLYRSVVCVTTKIQFSFPMLKLRFFYLVSVRKFAYCCEGASSEIDGTKFGLKMLIRAIAVTRVCESARYCVLD